MLPVKGTTPDLLHRNLLALADRQRADPTVVLALAGHLQLGVF
ncbi:MAG: hypothetical protein WKG07_43585 [Hymenobacter sp.]